jgi:proteic killer suppression protein
MIKSFKCRETEKIFRRERSAKFPPGIQRLADLRIPPGNRLEALAGDRKGRHSIRINDQWRICFHWRDNDAHDVEIVDYH